MEDGEAIAITEKAMHCLETNGRLAHNCDDDSNEQSRGQSRINTLKHIGYVMLPSCLYSSHVMLTVMLQLCLYRGLKFDTHIWPLTYWGPPNPSVPRGPQGG